MQNVIKEAQFLTTLEHKNFIKSYYNFLDMEHVQIKYLQTDNNEGQSPRVTYQRENRYVFCILMEYADKGDLNQLITKHRREKTLIPEETIWNYA